MNARDLLRQIGDQGDALWEGQLSNAVSGTVVTEEMPGEPDFSYCYHTYNEWEAQGQPGGWPLAYLLGKLHVQAPVDLVSLLGRVMVSGPLWLAWAVKRFVDRQRGVSYFCPLCHNPMREAWQYCPECKGVLPRLKPSLKHLTKRDCPHCGRRSWPVFTLSAKPAGPLVCRDAAGHSGCYRPHRLEHLAGQYSAGHIALAGAGLAAKHVFLAHMIKRYTTGAGGLPTCLPAWSLSELEVRLIESVAWAARRQDTGPIESPGERWTLARTLVLRVGQTRQLKVLHNLADDWLDDTQQLATNSVHWGGLQAMVLVLDPELSGTRAAGHWRPQAEVWSRIVRAAETYCDLPSGSVMPFRLGVAVPVWPQDKTASEQLDANGSMTAQAARQRVLDGDPALHALLTRTTAPHRLAFFGGLLPEKPDIHKSAWLTDLLRWVG